MKKSQSEEPPTALAAFMSELKASKPVVGLVNDNPRANGPPPSFSIVKMDNAANGKATQRWIPAMEPSQSQQRLDKILRVNTTVLEESIRLTTTPADPLSTSESSTSAPFKPQRRNSPVGMRSNANTAPTATNTNTSSEALPVRPRRKESIDSSDDEKLLY